MEKKGHSISVINRDSKIINTLLDFYNINHKIRNSRPSKSGSMFSIVYLIGMIYHICKYSYKERPDLYLGFGSFPCTIAGFLFSKPVIHLDDTEHNKVNHFLNKPFKPITLTPYYFTKNLGKNQIYFNAFIEQLYLHSNYYKVNNSVLVELGIESENYALVRYISYNASHDLFVQPLSNSNKMQLIDHLSSKMKVLVSFEDENQDDFYKSFKINISPEKMHDLIANARIFITEGATMASEAGVLGIPYIYINPLQDLGYITEQIRKYPEIASRSKNIEEIKCILNDKFNALNSTFHRRDDFKYSFEKSTIDPTKFLVWFVENYPDSFKIMKENPDYQYNFK